MGASTQFLDSELGNLLDVGFAGRNLNVIHQNGVDRIERSGAEWRDVAGVTGLLRFIRRRSIAWRIERAFVAGMRKFAEELADFAAGHEQAINDEDGAKIVNEFAASAGFRQDFGFADKRLDSICGKNK